MFDRVLLILLLLLLPVGIVVSRVVTGELSINKSASLATQEKKIEAMMEKVNQGMGSNATIQQEFAITGLLYASESGVLTVAGLAPHPNAFVWVWIAATSSKNSKAEATGSAAMAQTAVWDGPKVIKPANGGVFSIEVETKTYTGLVEVRLEQGQSVTMIRYDISKRAQVN